VGGRSSLPNYAINLIRTVLEARDGGIMRLFDLAWRRT